MRPPLPTVDGVEVEHRDIVVDGVRLHVALAGAGPPVLLQHGWPQHWWCWRRVIGPLSRSFQVVCPDLRGLGWSAAPRSGYEKETLAGDLLGVLDALQLDQVRLVGHDWGGLTGFLACLRAPERFSGFLALGISHPWPAVSGRPSDVGALARLWYQVVLSTPLLGSSLIRSPAVVRRMLRQAGDGVFGEEDVDCYAAALASEGGARASVGIYRTFLTRELVPMLRGRYADQRLQVPCRLLLGALDPVLTEDSIDGLQEHCDAPASAQLLPGAGHWLPEQLPELVISEVQALPG